MAYIAVIGAGSWGTTLASLLAEKEYDVILWSHEPELAAEMAQSGMNTVYLPGVKLPDGLKFTADVREAVHKARYVLSVVPAQFTRSVFSAAQEYIPGEAVIISASKGIEQKSLLTVSRILKGLLHRKIAVLSGPSFAQEVARRQPTAVTLATGNPGEGLLLQEIFNTSFFRVYTHSDVLGVELGGALKNVIAIAAGISDGLSHGHNARAALITRGLVEITRLGRAMGADPMTFTGLSGLGDLVLTCTGPLSRNYTVGLKLGQGETLKDILAATRSVAEGVATAQSAYELSKTYGIEMPIVEQVYDVIYADKPAADAVGHLMNRALRSEF